MESRHSLMRASLRLSLYLRASWQIGRAGKRKVQFALVNSQRRLRVPAGGNKKPWLDTTFQRRKEAVDVFLVVEHMRREPHPRQPRCNMNTVGGQSFDQTGRQAAGKTKAENV